MTRLIIRFSLLIEVLCACSTDISRQVAKMPRHQSYLGDSRRATGVEPEVSQEVARLSILVRKLLFRIVTQTMLCDRSSPGRERPGNKVVANSASALELGQLSLLANLCPMADYAFSNALRKCENYRE